MTDNQSGAPGLNLLSFDDGGITGLSALLILREIMARLQLKGEPSKSSGPWEHFDLITGTGTGAICAVMIGRLRMSVEDSIRAYVDLASDVFCHKKLIVQAGSGVFRAKKFEQALRTIVKKATGDAEERMMEEDPNQVRCKVVVYAMSAHNLNASLPCAFRTYPANANAMPDCPIWKALRASTAHPELFKRIEIEELGVGQHYAGGGLGCGNPTAQLLKEAAILYPNRPVGSVISIGTGHARTIQIRQPGWFERLLPVGALTISRTLEVAHRIAMDNERVAEEMAARFSAVKGVYFRLNVDQGIQSIEPSQWEKRSEVAGHTFAYMQKVGTVQLLDSLVDAVRERRGTIRTYQIDGSVVLSSSGSLMKFSVDCPPPTSMFTGRTTEVELIIGYFENNEQAKQVFVLHGLGGSGKTQTALRYVELMGYRFEGVIFIDGSSRENVEATLDQFAKTKRLGDSYQNALTWIGSREKRWLMLFDNVDDPEVEIQNYFPRSNRYSVLITTRHELVASLARGEGARCRISELDLNDARRLLLDAAGLSADRLQESENTAATEVLKEFGYLALAIIQCGAYICQTKCSIAQYLDMYRAECQEMLKGSGVKVEGYRRSLHATWELSHKRLSEPSKRLLGLSAFLHRERISVEIFRRASLHVETYRPAVLPKPAEADAQQEVKDILCMFKNENGDWSNWLFRSKMGELLCLSLVTVDTPTGMYRFHPLVQQWVRSIAPDRPAAIERAASLLALSIDRDKSSEACAFRRAVVPHVNEIIGLHPTPNANNAWQFVHACEEVGELNTMERLELQVLEERRRQLGDEHQETLESMANVAGTHAQRGRLEQAEELYTQVLAVRKRVLGDDDPDTLRSMAELAVIYHNQGRLTKAEDLEVYVLDARSRVLGDEDPDTLWSMVLLAGTYHNQNRLVEAERLRVQVLATRERLLGRDNPDTLRSMAELAGVYHAQDRLVEAEKLEVDVIAAQKRVLGDGHPDTLRSMEDLAVIYHNQGRLEEAKALKIQVLASNRQTLGADHPETLRSMAELATTFYAQGQLKEAEELGVDVLAARKRVLGDDHPDTLWSMAELATTFHAQGRLKEAEELEVDVLAARKRVLGGDHPDTLWSMAELAEAYRAQDRLAKAEEIYIELLAAQKRVLGDKHPETLQCMRNLALNYQAQGRQAEYQSLMSECGDLVNE